eukprot:SM000253S09053  [mRNA]  locus=s253:32573:34498:- [translate_table: standard]
MEAGGVDSEGRHYETPADMWRAELGSGDWYERGVKYWEGVEASVDGVLGGYGTVSGRDIAESAAFLRDAFGAQLAASTADGRRLVAADCGAGVGRVTQHLLRHFFHEVDLIEPVDHFLAAARNTLESSSPTTTPAVSFICLPLQDFTPQAGRYDVIWAQWCLGHLTDHDFVLFFRRAQAGLKLGGLIVVKENNANQGFNLDKEDSSLTRSDPYLRDLLRKSGLHLRLVRRQKNFPKELYAVRMYALSPDEAPAIPIAKQTRLRQKSNLPGLIS